MATDPAQDRVGLGWRHELAHGLHLAGGGFDLLEFLADDWLADPRRPLHELTAWGSQVPIHLHGTRLGLGSAEPLDENLLHRWRDLIAAVRPAAWSEHLALVGAGTTRLPHFAAPARTSGGAAAIARNVTRIQEVVGSLPLLENPATLAAPLGSTLDEASWLGAIAGATRADFLLDLHNLFANAHNLPGDPLVRSLEVLDRLPLHRVRAVHLAGGRPWKGRWLDDHRHPVPHQVWVLLEELARRIPRTLDVILERDGDFPPVDELLNEAETARKCLARGRQRPVPRKPWTPEPAIDDLTTGRLQDLSVELLVDGNRRRAFLANPRGVTANAGLDPETCQRLETADGPGLELAAASLAAKAGRIAP